MIKTQDFSLNPKEGALEELLYRSVTVPNLQTNDELKNILSASRRKNSAAEITGMLIYYRGEFIQILEGSKQSIDDIYGNHIAKDLRHTKINILARNSISSRSFEKWSMELVESEEIETKYPATLNGLLMKMFNAGAHGQELSAGVGGFISIYNKMREMY